MPPGAAPHFDPTDGDGTLTDDNLNALEMGGNVHQAPAGGLGYEVTALRYWRKTGTQWEIASFAGLTGQSVNPSVVTRVWLTDAGTIATSESVFPAHETTPHIRLATITSGVSVISSIDDERPRAIVVGGPFGLPVYTVATLPTGLAAGFTAFASDGRKTGEGASSGTGLQVYWDGANWFRPADDTIVAA